MGNKYPPCIKSTRSSIQTRQCFMTGEYCAQQSNIQKARKRLHDKEKGNDQTPEINAFVIMNFSSISDVVYESRIKPFVEGLKKYLLVDTGKPQQIACVPSGDQLKSEEHLNKYLNKHPDMKRSDSNWKPVSKINVVRADSNPVSNYIICNRICQQMQTADLIIVDVSVESANIFYEFGLATAFHKLILPICFSDRFFEMKLPEKLEAAMQQTQSELLLRKSLNANPLTRDKEANLSSSVKALEKHIDCYPWRRTLFEHFGIRCDLDDIPQADRVRYLPRKTVFSDKYGFSDLKYQRFPYTDKKNATDNQTVGETIYDWLFNSYNQPGKSLKDIAPQYNTLVVYTMDEFLNGDQAGHCIVNFYNNITRKMRYIHSFCGDRVAVIGSDNLIWDDPKDAKTSRTPPYGVRDLIRIGMDQATYECERKYIKPAEYLNDDRQQGNEWKEGIKQSIKSHIRNRCISLNPENPIYVTQYQSGIQKDIDKYLKEALQPTRRNKFPFICLYHIMLKTLCYTDEIVVDLSKNSIQAMFWMGAAHGSNVRTIAVRHEMSEKEKDWSGTAEIKKDRPILDISGLWTAMLRYGETSSFYNQLHMLQQSIAQHARLILPGTTLSSFEDQALKNLYRHDKRIKNLLKQKEAAEAEAMESYYRDAMWKRMLQDNQLHLYLPLNDSTEPGGSRLQVIKWDVDAAAELSNYLSKRKVIGEYTIDTVRVGAQEPANQEKDTHSENTIIIGDQTAPFFTDEKKTYFSLAAYINEPPNTEKLHVIDTEEPHVMEKCKDTEELHVMKKWVQLCSDDKSLHPVSFRGFQLPSAKGIPAISAPFYSQECMQRCSSSCLGNCQKEDQASKKPKAEQPQQNEVERPRSIVFTVKNDKKDIVSKTDATCTASSLYFRFRVSSNGTPYLQLYCGGKNTSFDNADDCITDCCKSLLKSVITGGEEITFRFQNPTMQATTSNRTQNKPIGGDYVLVEDSDPTNTEILTKLFSLLQDHILKLEFDGTTVKPTLQKKPKASAGTNEFEFHLPAQLLLWREKPATGQSDHKFHISLVGASGPATKALTALLVDKDQKRNMFENTKLNYHLLNDLQLNIRKEFFRKLSDNLKNNCTAKLDEKAIYTVKTYLRTLLYRYFLPFLSTADEHRICNALEGFLLASQIIPQKQIKPVLDTLKSVLADFQGAEAFYEVTVQSSQNTFDSRRITEIREWPNQNVRCIFVTPTSDGGKNCGKENETHGNDPGRHHPDGQ